MFDQVTQWYDYFPQHNLTHFRNKPIKNYTAGQINGTTGYEEAACQFDGL